MSEFGRTVTENGNRGTDHGHATAMLVLGGGVRGGRIYGRWPGLAPEQRFEGRDLAVTTDFRTLFHEITTHHLTIPTATPLFPGWTHPQVSGPPLLTSPSARQNGQMRAPKHRASVLRLLLSE